MMELNEQMEKQRKKLKRARKKARLKATAKIKHRMEISRTVSSLLGFVMSALSLLHVYHIT